MQFGRYTIRKRVQDYKRVRVCPQCSFPFACETAGGKKRGDGLWKVCEGEQLIRVLHVLDKISVDSGASVVVMNYYKKLDHKKLTFDFMVHEDLDEGTRAYIESNGSEIFIMPRLKAANLFKYIKALREFYRDHDYKIIHGHLANCAVFYLGLAKDVPYRIIHSHNTRASDVFWKRVRNWVLVKFVRKVANRYVACSNEAASFLFGRGVKAEIFNNAIDVDRFVYNQIKCCEMRNMLGIGSKLVIGHVGRFCKQKNHIFLLDVFSDLHKENSNSVLLLIGDGELFQDVVRETEKRKLQEAVIFAGVQDNIADYMNAMDVLTLPSLFEGLPLVAVEAQASGLQVCISEVVSREVDITETVVFLPLDKAAWIKALTMICEWDRIKMGQKVKESKFSIETQIQQLSDYYKELLKHEL